MNLHVFVLLQSLYTTYALDCYDCTDVPSISSCHSVAYCPNSTHCYIESNGSGSNKTYSMGCDTSSKCTATTTSSPTTIAVPSLTTGKVTTPGNVTTSGRVTTQGPVTINMSTSTVNHTTNSVTNTTTTRLRTQPMTSDFTTTIATATNTTTISPRTNTTTSLPPSQLVGKREWMYSEDLDMFDESVVNFGCCSADSCNKHLLEPTTKPIMTPTLPESGCHDKPGSDCKLYDELFKICDDIQKAKDLCKKTCNLCTLVDGNWSEWSNWTNCDVTCGNGTRMRNRTCDDPAPKAGGDNCTGSDMDVDSCTERNCPMDGDWATWASWSSCSVTCGIGLQKRARNCSDPFPEADGLFCLGASNDEKICIKEACEDSTWLEWSSWGKCSQTCDFGLSTRERDCNITSLIGHACLGDAHETKLCKEKECQIEAAGAWLQWSQWTACSRTCGTGIKTRSRNCNGTGNSCFGDMHESSLCEDKECKKPISAFLTYGVAENGLENGTIYFTNVITNVGEDYNMSTGQFTCRIPGIYSFHISIEKLLDVNQAYCHLMKNDNATIFVGSRSAFVNGDQFQQASNSAVLELQTGDVIYLGMCSDPSTFTVKSTFSGTLIVAEDDEVV